jgi:ribose 5-phosphate isomerase A
MASDSAKLNAAKAALLLVKPGMCVGLGTGSTSELFVKLLAASPIGKSTTCIPTSLRTADLARAGGLRVAGFDEIKRIDLAVDGADAVDVHFNLLKGMGGALTREKVIAYRAEKFAVIVDEAKMKQQLGGIVPVEVLPFAFSAVAAELALLASPAPKMRKSPDGMPFRTDSGNYLLDVPIAKIPNAAKLEKDINALPGVVENGIFTRADIVLVGNEKGSRTLINKKKFAFPYFLRRRA